jgi:tetratricopeptide (TPR) repeat protein
MLKTILITVCCSFFSLLLFGLEKGVSHSWKQDVGELSHILQSDIARADSILNHCADCWEVLDEKQLYDFSWSLGYLCEISDDTRCFQGLIRQLHLKKSSPSLEVLSIGMPTLFGQLLSEADAKKLKEITSSSEKKQKVVAHYFLGLHYLHADDFDTSEKLFKAVLQLLKSSKEEALICKTFQQLALLEAERKDYKKAFEHLLKSLNYAKDNGLKYEQALSDKLIGELLIKMDNHKGAESYLGKGLSLSRSLFALRLEADILTSLGTIQLLRNNSQGAILDYSLALSKYYKLDYTRGIAYSHLRLGEVYKESKSYKLSKENYLLSQGYLEENNDSIHLADAFYCLAEIEYTMGNFTSAKSYIQQAIVLLSQLSEPFDLYKSYLLSAKIKEKLGDHRAALNDLLRYTTFADSVQTTDLKAKIAELSELYKSEQKENVILQQTKELEELTIQAELREQKLENTSLRNRQMIFLLLAILFAGTAVFVWFRFKRKQEKAKQLHYEAELKQTVLRSQMNPHFIFNSMSVIQSYIYSKDTENSSVFIVNFSRLMRLILENSSKEFIPLSTELEILEKYLMIQKLRFDNRFDYTIDTGELPVENISIPPMLTQPFIENSIEHGGLESISGGRIRISFSLEKDLIKIIVEDNGIGVNAKKEEGGKKNHKSMALEITKNRIDLLNLKYKANGFLEVRDLKDEGTAGTRVTITTYTQKN